MTTIYINIGLKSLCWYYHNCALIRVSDQKEINFKGYPKAGFKCVTHTIYGPFVKANDYELKFLVPSEKNEGCKCLQLCQASNGDQCTIKCKIGYNQLYVYFYGDDPRPLLLCYNKKAYRPQTKECYFDKWVEVANGVDKCVCSNKDECDKCDKLLEELVKVVGFLNEVNLYKHPPVTGTGDNGKDCTSTSDGIEGNNYCKIEKNGDSCNYPVHEYNRSKVQVRVKCSDVSGKEPSTSCYKKLTHEPAGINGQTSTKAGDIGFRLGNVVYKGNGCSNNCSIPYYTENGADNKNRSSYWCKPLLKVTAYFYNEDKHYSDPLLVVLYFKNGGSGNDKECYKLIKTANGPGMTWEKDQDACEKVKENGNGLVKYLDGIRYSIKKVLQIKLECKGGQYPINVKPGKPKPGGTGNGFEQLPNGDKTITVEECTNDMCAKLSEYKYKCFKHQLSSISGFDYNKIAGVAFTIPSQSGGDNVIQLYENGDTRPPKCQNGEKNEQIQLTYNRCMKDVYVFFYGTGSHAKTPDTVPLMLWYNNSYYGPCDRDKYFEKWVQVPKLSGEPCKNGDVNGLVGELDNVNKALNIIELDKSTLAKSGTAKSGYGLPKEVGGVTVDKAQFPTDRVKLTRQDGPKQGPSKPPGTPAYYRVVHRTYNGFEIGTITYNGQDFVASGVSIKGTDTKITVKTGSNGEKTHTTLVKTHQCNTVVAYYSKSDDEYKLPQLIVILKIDGPIDNGGTVTGTTNTPYGYYILTNKNGGKDFEYKWVPVTESQTAVKLDDATDFSLLNSIVILIDKQCKNAGSSTSYNDSEISNAIRTANLKSPGQPTGTINRITNKTINVTDATGTEGACLQKYGYKLCSHDFKDLVPEGPVSEVKLIAGLRFLIPTGKEGQYGQLKVLESGTSGNTNGKELFLYHQSTGDENKKICVYFYQSTSGSGYTDPNQGDPRPLMLCYNNSAYGAQTMNDYFDKWVLDTNVTTCVCTEREGNGLLKALVDVSNILNPVDIKTVPTNGKETTYKVHFFKEQNIKIKVEFTKANEKFCYHRYTHTHCGTGNCRSDGKGFRLGTIDYCCRCIKLNETSGKNGECITSQLDKSHPYNAASKVVVFYYKHDQNHEFPMVVAMGKTSREGKTMCNLFYTLKDKANKKYQRKVEDKEFNLDNNDEVTKKLDDALFGTSNHLQIIIDQRPEPKLYCPAKKGDKKPPIRFKCVDRKNGHQTKSGQPGSTNEKFIPPSYPAKLYGSNISQQPNGPTTPTTTKTEIKVTLLDCWQLNTYGYRCYKHQITSVTNVDQIGGLKFYLWDNREGVCGYGGCNRFPCSIVLNIDLNNLLYLHFQ